MPILPKTRRLLILVVSAITIVSLYYDLEFGKSITLMVIGAFLTLINPTE